MSEKSDPIKAAGGPAAVARWFGIKAPSVTQWRRNGIPPDRCPHIEAHTEGRVPCEQQRADLPWLRVPDPAWRWHPAGRPLLDYARWPASKPAR